MRGVKRPGATILGECFKRFETQGVSGVVIIAESHFTLQFLNLLFHGAEGFK
ncbi:MAG TPA: hypothetical protein HPQ03_00920 [Deltaproteobacteria bacterium]|nr:hypothetical protein [Deltaproteobacteria bacterium]